MTRLPDLAQQRCQRSAGVAGRPRRRRSGDDLGNAYAGIGWTADARRAWARAARLFKALGHA